MSPARFLNQSTDSASLAVTGFFALLGARLNDARRERGWDVPRLAKASGVSRALVYDALRGEAVSMDAAMRMISALALKLEWDLVDPRRKAAGPRQDVVHSAMGEFEARHLSALGYKVAIDEPYQHYQFAGRADLVAWDLNAAALLHIENRTCFPDLQEAAGAFNAKKAYLGRVLAERNGLRGWRSETHVMAAFWSSEILHSLRFRTETFRALCPDGPDTFEQWWAGIPPSHGRTAAFVVIGPLASGRQRPFASLDKALITKPRHQSYAKAATRLHG